MTSTTTEPTSATGLEAFKPRILHIAYHVSDIERSLAFYVGVLGLKEQMRIPLGKGLHEVVLGYPDGKGVGVILMWNTQRTTPYERGDGYSRFVIHVNDVDGALRYLAANNTQIVQDSVQAGSLKYAMIKDPDGYVIELLQVIRS